MALDSLITTILAVVLFVGVILLFWKIRLSKGMRVLIVAALLATVFGASMLLYYLPSFKTPEDALAYGYGGDILLSAEAAESAALLYRKDANATATTLLFLDKQDGRYKLGTVSLREQIAQERTERGTVTLYRIKNTSDYFVRITGLADEKFTVTDSTGRAFQTVFDRAGEDGYIIHALEAVDCSEGYTVYLGELAVPLAVSKG